jgi:hypothetical protein
MTSRSMTSRSRAGSSPPRTPSGSRRTAPRRACRPGGSSSRRTNFAQDLTRMSRREIGHRVASGEFERASPSLD